MWRPERIKVDLAHTHECEKTIGYTFQQPMLLWQALSAAGSYNMEANSANYGGGNKRLAIVGDRILDLLLALEWYPTGCVEGEHNAQDDSEYRGDASACGSRIH